MELWTSTFYSNIRRFCRLPWIFHSNILSFRTSKVTGQSNVSGNKKTLKTLPSGILKQPTTLKISIQVNKPNNRSVRFLDSAGLPLTEVREFNESEELMEKNQQNEKSEQNLSKNEDEDSKPLFRCAFNQPAANYLEFRQKLERNFVGLATLHFQGPRQFCGTVKVKNCAFEKKVFLRITFNSWESSSDIQCLYVDNGKTMHDTFCFETVIPSSWYTYHKIQFCVCFVENGRQHWDNNNGNNYSILSNLDEVSLVEVPGDPYLPLFSFRSAYNTDDAFHPSGSGAMATLVARFCASNSLPGLTAIVKHNDHAMTWYDHGDSYSPWYDHGKIMAWSSWNLAWSWYGRHGK